MTSFDINVFWSKNLHRFFVEGDPKVFERFVDEVSVVQGTGRLIDPAVDALARAIREGLTTVPAEHR